MKTCGTCTLCCTVVPVKEIDKRSFTPCRHLRTIIHKHGPGCSIYPERPFSCKGLACVWLDMPEIEEQYRPDRVGFVVDTQLDVVTVNGNDRVAAQIWVEQGHEEDWRYSEAAHKFLDALFGNKDITVVLWRISPDYAYIMAEMPDGKIHVTPEPLRHSSDALPELDRSRRLRQLMGAEQ